MLGAGLIDRLLDKAIDSGKFGKINWVLNRGVPFNIAHGIKLTSISRSSVSASLPYKRKNLNHLKGIHACALCLLGEFPAGILLISKFSFKEYRLILSDLSAEYLKQGRTHLKAVATWPEGLISKEIRDFLEKDDSYTLQLHTRITDTDDDEVARVTTTWQLKSWDKVSLK